MLTTKNILLGLKVETPFEIQPLLTFLKTYDQMILQPVHYRLQDTCNVWPFCLYLVKQYPWFYIVVMGLVSKFWTKYSNVICMSNKTLMVWTECYVESWEIVLSPWYQMDLHIAILRIDESKLWYVFTMIFDKKCFFRSLTSNRLEIIMIPDLQSITKILRISPDDIPK